MMRSMFAGVSGLRAHQTMMDVVGNNVANVNTVGYRGSRASFADTLSQTVRAADAAGVGAAQIGLGVRLGGIGVAQTQGSLQSTGRPTDLAISGGGFFAVRQGDATVYTRAGAFGIDTAGNLVDPTGAVLQGWAAGADGAVDTAGATGDLQLPLEAGEDGVGLRSFAIGDDGTVRGTFSDGSERVLGQVALATFANPGGLLKVGDSHFAGTGASGEAVLAAPGTGAAGNLAAGTLEMSNVELAEEFSTLILAQRGFSANSRVISASDEMLQDLVNLKR